MKRIMIGIYIIVGTLLLIGITGCGTNNEDRMGEGTELIEEADRVVASDALIAVETVTDSVNGFVADNIEGFADASEVETAMAGFASEYSNLAADIEAGKLGETDELALSLARAGEEKVTSLGETLASNPESIDYTAAAVVDWGEYSDTVYGAVADDPAISDPSLGDRKGKGPGDYGKGKSYKKGYCWWRYGSDGEQYRERERDRECDGVPKHDGSGKGMGKGKGSGKGGGGGGKGSGGKGKGW